MENGKIVEFREIYFLENLIKYGIKNHGIFGIYAENYGKNASVIKNRNFRILRNKTRNYLAELNGI